MKPKFFINATLLLMLVSFCSCGPRNGVTAPEPYYTLIRFTDPAYRNNIIVNRVYVGDTCYFEIMRGNQCIGNPNHLDYEQRHWEDYDIPERPRDPYWELPDGWFLVDWAWRYFPYRNLTLLTEMTWDKYDGNYQFDTSVPHINSGFIEEIQYLGAKELMYESHPDGNYPIFESWLNGPRNEYQFYLDMLHSKALSKDTIYDCLCAHADKCDEFWAYIQTEIAASIKKGNIHPQNK